MTPMRARMLSRVSVLMVRLRFLALVFASIIVAVVPFSALEGVERLIYGALAVGLVYNSGLALALRRARPERLQRLAIASVLADTLLVSIIVWATGGVTSPFFVAYYGIGIVAAIYGGVTGAILGSVLMAIAFGVVSSLAFGFIPWWASVYVHFALRVGFATAVSLFTALLTREVEMLSTSNEELQRLNRLLHLRSTLSEIINATAEPVDLLLLAAKRLREETGIRRCLVLVTPAADGYLLTADEGDAQTIIRADAATLAARYPSAERAITERRSVQTPDPDDSTPSAIEPTLSLPLLGEERVLGALYLEIGGDHQGVDADALRELTTIASQLAVKLENILLMTDLHRAYNELRQVDHLKSSILANTSHELRTPLTLILGYSEALLGGLGGPLNAEQTTFATGIRQSGKRLQGLVENLLSVASMEKGPISLNLQALDLDRQLDYVITSLQPAISAKGLTVVRRVSEPDRWVRADQQALRQVLNHLLKNAIEFSPAGGPLTIETLADPAADQVQVRVTDAGIGLTSEQVGSLFTKFYQADNSSRRTHEGAGLGLYISKRLVEAHDGRIWVESEPGCGSTFGFTLPRGATEPALPRPEPVTSGQELSVGS